MEREDRLEAHIIKENTILLRLGEVKDEGLEKDFCGITITVNKLSSQEQLPCFSYKTVYLCGDISMANSLELGASKRVLIIREYAHGHDKSNLPWPTVDLGQVPILVQGMGVYYRRFFNPDIDYFRQISNEHTFQSLTESTKSGKAHRTGIYLTPVEENDEGLHFHLLRCSTNLSGPSENFRANDKHIVDALNQEATSIFEDQSPLNHVLAQIYRNTPATNIQKQTKAKISSHADKTKDMPSNGIMAFCTFYDELERLQPLPNDRFDYGYKNSTGLTKLRFRLKNSPEKDTDNAYPADFTVTLYPNSVFFMPLSTNRLYTHEIKPSMLDADKLPTRLGYVVRCSSTEAVHSKGQTFLKKDGELIKLEPPTIEGMDQLRKLYADENKTQAFIDYNDRFLFSMNEGDYSAPIYEAEDEFRQYNMEPKGTDFKNLLTSVRFESICKGRRGVVLVKGDDERGTPIVRTTTKYSDPAQYFHSVHHELAKLIAQRASLPFSFNNALIEHYTDEYTRMGFHSDQAQDLKSNSSIAIFSCYKNPELKHTRKLVVKSKEPNGHQFEIPLLHNSVVVFNLNTNQRFKHKIVLDTATQELENEWIGVTFRTSGTFVHYSNEQAYFEDGTQLLMASEEESRKFYPLRRRENLEADFIYPNVAYTLSESDIAPPEDFQE